MKNSKSVARMKNSILMILSIIVFALTNVRGEIHQEPKYQVGQFLTVVAPSGLTLRSSPDLHGTPIKVIQFGDEVRFKDDKDSLHKYEQIKWVEGHWIHVSHEGDEGYIFDGFLTHLDLPRYDFEKTQTNLNFAYPLIQWAERCLWVERSDTIVSEHSTKIIDLYATGDKMVKINEDGMYRTEMHLSGLRMMDVYHLLYNMLLDDYEKKVFGEESLFIEDHEGRLSRIKIDLDNPVEIKLKSNGGIKLIVHNYIDEC